ncbi:MAG: MoaD/ThiS family protein, partial [Egibacteraceae bacterium]
MAVRVRFFAALREAAGTDEAEADPGPLPQLLAGLAARYGEPFATRLSVSAILIDGGAVARDAQVEV